MQKPRTSDDPYIQANSLTMDCNELLALLADKNPFHLPESLKKLEGTTHTFQFHFDTMSTSRRPDFVLETVFQNLPLPLPAPPPQHPTLPLPATLAQPLTETTEPLPTLPLSEAPTQNPTDLLPTTPQPLPIETNPTLLLPEAPPQNLTDFASTAPEPLPIQTNVPTSPALSTTVSNEPEVIETEIEKPNSPKTTPPGNQSPVETKKELKRKSPPQSSARRSLFTGHQEITPSELTKKTKHEDTKADPVVVVRPVNTRHRWDETCLLDIIVIKSTDVVGMALRVQNINHSAFRSMLEKEKLFSNNFNDWFARLKLVLRVENKLYVIEQPLPPALEPVAEPDIVAQWTALYDAHTEIACLMLGSMTPELHRQFELHYPYDMIQELRSMFEKQARVEKFDLIQYFHACKQEEGKPVADYVLKMKGYVEKLESLGYVLP
ncbi:hypothetical protein Tco_1504195 [Tanacetum coccineum]